MSFHTILGSTLVASGCKVIGDDPDWNPRHHNIINKDISSINKRPLAAPWETAAYAWIAYLQKEPMKWER